MLVLYLVGPVLVLFSFSSSSTMLKMSLFSVLYLSAVGTSSHVLVLTLRFFLVVVRQLRGLHCYLTGYLVLLGITILVCCTVFFCSLVLL
jgi:hypothetical protein